MKNFKLIMTHIDKDDLLTEALDEFHGYRLYLKHCAILGKDDDAVADARAKYENDDFKARLKDFLEAASKVNAAITVAAI
jgi:hypothetical protein